MQREMIWATKNYILMFKIGIDTEETARFVALVKKKAFLYRIYTVAEIEYILSKNNSAEISAGIFCAKEAAAKALGTGFFGVHPRNIEIFHDEHGAPFLRLLADAKDKFPSDIFEVSISHTKNIATAIVLRQI